MILTIGCLLAERGTNARRTHKKSRNKTGTRPPSRALPGRQRPNPPNLAEGATSGSTSLLPLENPRLRRLHVPPTVRNLILSVSCLPRENLLKMFFAHRAQAHVCLTIPTDQNDPWRVGILEEAAHHGLRKEMDTIFALLERKPFSGSTPVALELGIPVLYRNGKLFIERSEKIPLQFGRVFLERVKVRLGHLAVAVHIPALGKTRIGGMKLIRIVTCRTGSGACAIASKHRVTTITYFMINLRNWDRM